MTKIRPSTTLAELATLRARHGVVHLTLSYDYGDAALHRVRCVLHTARGQHYGHGPIECEALDDAFSRLEHVVGLELRTT